LSFSLGNIRQALPQLPYCGYLHGSPRNSEYLLQMRSALPDRSTLSVLFREDSAMTPRSEAIRQLLALEGRGKEGEMSATARVTV
jgi:hypothetical protein